MNLRVFYLTRRGISDGYFARLCFVNFLRHVAFDSIQLLAPEKSERLPGKTQLQRLVQKVKL